MGAAILMKKIGSMFYVAEKDWLFAAWIPINSLRETIGYLISVGMKLNIVDWIQVMPWFMPLEMRRADLKVLRVTERLFFSTLERLELDLRM